MERAALATLARVERMLPRRLQQQVTALRPAALLLARPSEPVLAAELGLLAEACAGRQLVPFDYVARSGDPTTRRAEPYRLVCTVQRRYPMAFDLDEQDWRTFGVDRLANLAVTGHTFTPRRLEDPEQLVRTALSSAPYRYRAEVLVALPPEELARRVSPNVGIVEPSGDESLLRMGADCLAWLAGLPQPSCGRRSTTSASGSRRAIAEAVPRQETGTATTSAWSRA